ncbi:MAG: hypothetical protein H0U70_08960 [Tatlockia sp.]|nr:hypothetical protein [Tatlockia sp.]
MKGFFLRSASSSAAGLYGETPYSRLDLLIDHRSPAPPSSFRDKVQKRLLLALAGMIGLFLLFTTVVPLFVSMLLLNLLVGVLLYRWQPSILGSMFSRIHWTPQDTAGVANDFRRFVGERNTLHYVPVIAYAKIELNADLPEELTRNWLQPGATYEAYYSIAHAADATDGKGIKATVPLLLLKFQYRDPNTGKISEVTQTGGYPVHRFFSSPRTIWYGNTLRSGPWYRKLGVLMSPSFWLHTIPQVIELKNRGNFRQGKFSVESLPWSTLLWYAWGEEESCRFTWVPQHPTARTPADMKDKGYETRLAQDALPIIYDLCIQKKKREANDRDAWHIVDERLCPLQKIGTMTLPKQDLTRPVLQTIHRKARINIADNPADMQVLGPHVARIHLYDVMQAIRQREPYLSTAELVQAVAGNLARQAHMRGILADRFCTVEKIKQMLQQYFDENKEAEDRDHLDLKEREQILNDAYTTVEAEMMNAHPSDVPRDHRADTLAVWHLCLDPHHTGQTFLAQLIGLIRSIQHMEIWRKDMALNHFGPMEAPSWMLDRFGRTVLRAALKRNAVPITAARAGPPAAQRTLQMNSLFGIHFPRHDPNVACFSSLEQVGIFLASSILPHPTDGAWASRRQAVGMIQQYFGRVLSPDLTPWNLDQTSDEATARFAFLGTGSPLIKPTDGKDQQRLTGLGLASAMACRIRWKIQLDYFTKYPMHPGVEPMGADAFFAPGEDYPRLVAIIRCGKLFLPPMVDDPDSSPLKDPEWEWAKFAFRSTVFTMVTVVHHFLYQHAISSNILNIAAHEQLPATHPLRSLLEPFIFGSTTVNQNALMLLFSKNGTIHRRCWTYEGIKQIAAEHYERFSNFYCTFEESIRANGVEELKLPYETDGTLVWNCIRVFVREFLTCLYDLDQPIVDEHVIRFYQAARQLMPSSVRSSPRMPEQVDWKALEFYLVHSLFEVTAGHTHLGQMVEYCRDPYMFSWRLLAGVPYASPQIATQFIVGVIGTGLPMPMLLDPDWPNHFPGDTKQQKQARRVFVTFQQRMEDIAHTIETANKTRRWPFANFSPKNMQISASI